MKTSKTTYIDITGCELKKTPKGVWYWLRGGSKWIRSADLESAVTASLIWHDRYKTPEARLVASILNLS